jgi:hypothetical protein
MLRPARVEKAIRRTWGAVRNWLSQWAGSLSVAAFAATSAAVFLIVLVGLDRPSASLKLELAGGWNLSFPETTHGYIVAGPTTLQVVNFNRTIPVTTCSTTPAPLFRMSETELTPASSFAKAAFHLTVLSRSSLTIEGNVLRIYSPSPDSVALEVTSADGHRCGLDPSEEILAVDEPLTPRQREIGFEDFATIELDPSLASSYWRFSTEDTWQTFSVARSNGRLQIGAQWYDIEHLDRLTVSGKIEYNPNLGDFRQNAEWSAADPARLSAVGAADSVVLNGEELVPRRWHWLTSIPASTATSIISGLVGFAFGLAGSRLTRPAPVSGKRTEVKAGAGPLRRRRGRPRRNS